MKRIAFGLLAVFLGFSAAFGQQDLLPAQFYFGTKPKSGIGLSRGSFQLEKDGFAYTGTLQARKQEALLGPDFTFWMKVPEGNYRVRLVMGSSNECSDINIRAESRRLLVYDHRTAAGDTDTITFIVNVRSARIHDHDSIRLKKREFEYLQWDPYLSLELFGAHPVVQWMQITKAEALPTVFLAGNSTVVDQDKEPWASWGQIFPAFLKPEVAVANFAESGETLKSFIAEGRLRKITSQIKPGDYLLMEFAHNDQKAGRNHVEPFSDYQEYLMKFVEVARNHGATPVLVTSTCRRVFDDQGKLINTLDEYPAAMRELAAREHILLIDLNEMSKRLFETLGPEGSKQAFVHYAADTFSWQHEALADDTHFSTYGAWQLAKCVVQQILESQSPLKLFVNATFESYNPTKPDALADWKWIISGNGSATKPDGY